MAGLFVKRMRISRPSPVRFAGMIAVPPARVRGRGSKFWRRRRPGRLPATAPNGARRRLRVRAGFRASPGRLVGAHDVHVADAADFRAEARQADISQVFSSISRQSSTRFGVCAKIVAPAARRIAGRCRPGSRRSLRLCGLAGTMRSSRRSAPAGCCEPVFWRKSPRRSARIADCGSQPRRAVAPHHPVVGGSCRSARRTQLSSTASANAPASSAAYVTFCLRVRRIATSQSRARSPPGRAAGRRS